MPGQRKKGKTRVSVWVTPEEKELLLRLAKSSGASMTDILKIKITDHVKKSEK
jgi:uncharacterized protein (DUF1778 family)